jgi:RNA-directed DNA polymerase
MTTIKSKLMDEWNTLPWKQLERSVFKLQQRIYRASSHGDTRTVRKLQRLLLNSRSAKLLAVRKVSQDNQGKKTAGIDGVKSLTPSQRLALSQNLKLSHKAQSVRRVWIPKPGQPKEQRALGIPVMKDRALQRLVQSALEPEWEARFEPNSYGFRPGRSCHDAIEAIFTAIRCKPKYVLDTDVEKCFDRIGHQELLQKANTSPQIRRQLKAWLKAGVIDREQWFPTESGTIQGSPLSPLLANIAMHGIEETIAQRYRRDSRRKFYPPIVVRYADDLVAIHEDIEVVRQVQEIIEAQLKPMGLRLKPEKTRITHTLNSEGGTPGFDFLGFNIRQYRVGKTHSGKTNQGQPLGFKTVIKPAKSSIRQQVKKLGSEVAKRRGVEQSVLIKALNPVIVGWTRYYSTVVSKRTFNYLDAVLFSILMAWAFHSNSGRCKYWVMRRYWRQTAEQRWSFQPSTGKPELRSHSETPIRRHVKVKGDRSIYDGDWVYWSVRLGRRPDVSTKVGKLLKKQQGKCWECGLYFREGDLMEVDHIIPLTIGGKNAFYNLQLLHRHCHDQKTARDQLAAGTNDNRQMTEEPCDMKNVKHGFEAERRGRPRRLGNGAPASSESTATR